MSFQEDFFHQHPLAENVLALFDFMPHVLFFAKSRDCRFVKVNPPFLDSLGLEHENQLIGKTPRDVHPPLLAESYIADDISVMRSRVPKPGQIWMMLHRSREPRWYVETKIPWFNVHDEVIGIIGTMCRIEQPEEMKQYLQELLPVAQYIEKNYAETISMADMADLADISSTQFNRRFRQLLRMTPMEYVRTVRSQVAQKLLTTTVDSIVEIAVAVGYSDQSHFTKSFRKTTGMTPVEYRKRFVK
jgi:AraC-like DNA-binding protein